MHFKVYRGSFGLIVLLILGLIFFMLPAILVFAMIATAVSVLAGVVNIFLGHGQKRKQQTITKTKSGTTIDIPAEIE